jgi:hypothetical protein
MRHTERMMAAVRASLLLGAVLPAASLAHAQPAPANKADERWKTSPEVQKAALQIGDWLADVTERDAKSRADVAAQFLTLAPVLDDALRRLVEYEQRAKRLGDGTDALPYRYYGRRANVTD